MKKIHRLLKVMSTIIFVVLIGLALFARKPKNEEAGIEPALFSTFNISASTPEISEKVIPSQAPSPQEIESDNSYTEQEKREADAAFSLLIHDREIVIWENVGEETLRRGPGWLPSSAFPGEMGSCIVYGHRNRTHLRILEQVKQGDEIRAILPDGRKWTYIVEELRIVNSDNELRFEAIEGRTLILTTCYPFRYSGSAPQKYIVISKYKST